MRRGKLAALLSVICVLAFAGVALAADPAPAEEPEQLPYKIGSTAKKLSVKKEDGTVVDLAKEGTGKKKACVIMSTACSACRSELDMMNKLFKAEPGLGDFVVIATDIGPYAKIGDFKKNFRFTGTWYQDEEFVVGPKFGFNFAPAMFVLDKDGKVIMMKAGWVEPNKAQFEQELREALK